MSRISEKSLDLSEDCVQYLLTEADTFAKLKNEPGCRVVKRAKELCGYEVYIVEQWACQRKLNYSIATYTGNPEHRITVSILSIPKDSKAWSPALKTYFDILIRLHLRPKETDIGLLYVTNLSSFPSNLNLISIPDGCVSKAIRLFRVNENLRRTGCGGRLVLSVNEPSDACSDKFEQVFKTHESVPTTFAVIELVTLIQISLFYCGLLEPQYVDGLLCDETVHGIQAWWNKWGRLRFNSKATDGTLGPTTVAAILGFITGIRNRLASLNYKAPKDPFDAEEFTFCLKQFQKHENLPKSSKIDDETIYRLYSMTGKASNSDFFGMVKSTMKEVSGKQVSSKGDSETLDLERFKNNAIGRRARYLFLGKGTMRTICWDTVECQSSTKIPLSSLSIDDEAPSNLDLRRAVIKSVSKGLSKNEAGGLKTGVMKIKNLPGRRSPRRRQSGEPIDPEELVKHLEYRLAVDQQGNDSSIFSADKEESENIARYLEQQRKSLQSPYWSSDDGHYSEGRKHKKDIGDSYDGSNGDKHDAEQQLSLKTNDESAVCAALAVYRELGDNFQTQCSKCQTKDDIQLFIDKKTSLDRVPLRRTYSFSSVDDLVFRRAELLSMAVVAKSYGRVKKSYHILCESTASLEAVKNSINPSVYALGDNLIKQTNLVHKTSSQWDEATEKLSELRTTLEKTEALVARLQYESRMVDMKVKDVEDSILSFGSKLEELEARVQYMKRGSPKSFIKNDWNSAGPADQFSSWFSFLHKYLTTQNQSND